MIDDLAGTLAYLCTPYSAYPRGIWAAFHDAAELAGRLLQIGINAYSPVVHSHPIAVRCNLDPFDYSIWLAFDEPMLDRCDVLIVAHMEGWADSKGIAFEVEYFAKRRKPIFDLDPDSLQLTKRAPARPLRARDEWTPEQIAADRAAWLGDSPPETWNVQT